MGKYINEELKPCPKCNDIKLNIRSTRTYTEKGYGHYAVTVICEDCEKASSYIHVKIPDGQGNEREICEREMKKAWNERISKSEEVQC